MQSEIDDGRLHKKKKLKKLTNKHQQRLIASELTVAMEITYTWKSNKNIKIINH